MSLINLSLVATEIGLIPFNHAFAISKDGGLLWSPPWLIEQVYCPNCQAGIQRYSPPPAGDKSRIIYSGPGGPKRNNMTIRLSYDEGKTWPVAKVLYAGPAAYSDLVRKTIGKRRVTGR